MIERTALFYWPRRLYKATSDEDAEGDVSTPFIVMPLKKSASKAAFKSNVKAEMHAGKPQKQAVAIAYATKRKAQSSKR
jgi:hypothetical protein